MLLLLVLACAPDPEKTDDTAEPWLAPDEAGPWAAGTLEGSFVSSSGDTTPVQAWYPSATADGGLHTYDDVFEASALDEPAADCASPRPVALFSHGNGGIRWQSVFLTERLASRGWVVVAPDHVRNTFFDEDGDAMAELVARRPLDIAESFDWLLEVASAAGGPLEGCVDPDAGYAMIGHSFGGYTAYAVAGATLDAEATAAWCADNGGWLCDEVATWSAETGLVSADLSDPRAWAAVPMTPAGYEALVSGYANISVPVLTLGGGRDTLTPMETVTPMYEALTGAPWRALGELVDAGHYTFSDACDLLPTYEDCAPPFLDPAEAHPLINTVTTAFLDMQRGNAEAEAWLPPEDERWAWTD